MSSSNNLAVSSASIVVFPGHGRERENLEPLEENSFVNSNAQQFY